MSTENVQNTRAALKFHNPQIARKHQSRNILLLTAPVSAIIAHRISDELEKVSVKIIIQKPGEVSEWLIELVSKTSVPDSGTAGSNPALSVWPGESMRQK